MIMTVYTVYKSPLEIKYFNRLLSKSVVFQCVFLILYFVIPFLVAYRSGGFWTTSIHYTETPTVNINRDSVIMEFITATNSILRWGTLEKYNSQHLSNLLVPSGLEIVESDTDQDGMANQLQLKFNSSEITTPITQAKILIPLTLSFSGVSPVSISSYLVIGHTSSISGDVFLYAADLSVSQKSPIASGGLTISLPDLSTLESSDMMDSAQISLSQNADARLSLINKFSVWNRKVGTEQPYQFALDIKINFTPIKLRYKSTFWYSVKWAWVQYIFIALFFYGIVESIRSFAFMNGIFHCFIRYPHIKCDRKNA